MKCILCKSRTTVLESRSYTHEGLVTRRRRECLNKKCKHKFTTYESYKERPLRKGEAKLVSFSVRDVDEAMDDLLSSLRQCQQISRSISEKCAY